MRLQQTIMYLRRHHFVSLAAGMVALLLPIAAHGAIALDQVGYTGFSTDYAAAQGTSAFVTVGDELLAVEVSDPANPVIQGRCSLLGENFASLGKVAGVEYSGGRVYILRDGGSVALQIVDASNPAALSLLGDFEAPAPDANDAQSPTGRSMSVDGTVVYLGVGSFGVYRLNAADATNVSIQSFYDLTPTPGESQPTVIDVAAADSKVFLLTENDSDVYSIDFGAPLFPTQIGGALNVSQSHLEADPNHVYLYDGSVQLLNAALPVTLPQVSNPGFSASALVPSGATLYTANIAQVRITSLATPSSPVTVGNAVTTTQPAVGNGDLAVAGSSLVLARGKDLGVVDSAVPSAPVFSGMLARHIAGEPLQAPVFSNGKYYVLSDTATFTGSNTASVTVLEPGVGGAPQLLGAIELSAANYPNEIAVSNDVIYAVTDTKLVAIDATAPQSMVISGSVNHPGSGNFGDTVSASGTTVYTGGTNGVNIYNAGNPASIQTIGQYVGNNFPTITPVVDLQIVGTLLYCASGVDGVQIVNVSNPGVPQALSVGSVGGADAREILVSGTNCFVRTSTELIRLVVTSPSSPVIASQLSLPGSSTLKECFSCGESYRGTFVVSGLTAYIAGGADGLQVADFTNAASPIILDSWDTDWLNYVALDSDLLYLAEDALEASASFETGLRVVTPPVGNTGGEGEGGALGGQITSIPYFAEEGRDLRLIAPAGTNHQWRRNGIDMANVPPRLTGTQEQELVFVPVAESDEATYTCVYDDGSKQLVETEEYQLVVYPVNTVPVSGHAGLAVAALLLFGLALMGLRSTRGQAQE